MNGSGEKDNTTKPEAPKRDMFSTCPGCHTTINLRNPPPEGCKGNTNRLCAYSLTSRNQRGGVDIEFH